MAYIAIDEENPFPFIASILKGNNEVNPLNKYQLNSIIYSKCAIKTLTFQFTIGQFIGKKPFSQKN
jgi:hypothetical protein